MAPNDPMQRQYAALCNDLKAAVTNWTALNGAPLTSLNALLVKNGLTPLAAAAPPLKPPVCGGPATTKR
jgi:hypothetical protein